MIVIVVWGRIVILIRKRGMGGSVSAEGRIEVNARLSDTFMIYVYHATAGTLSTLVLVRSA